MLFPTELKQQLEEVKTKLQQQEREFGEGRAKLKQLYIQKEGEEKELHAPFLAICLLI